MTWAFLSFISITQCVFFPDLLSLCQSQIGQPLTSPAELPDNLLPLSPAWLNPVCCAALCSARSNALSAGDRLFGIYPLLLLCLSLHLQPFMAVKCRLSSPLSFSSPFLPSVQLIPPSSCFSTSAILPFLLLIPSSQRL